MEKILNYKEREDLKEYGRELLSKTSSTEQKAIILLNTIIKAHYWRARECIESSLNPKTILRKIRGKKYYSGYILDIDHYTQNWLFSMKDRKDLIDKETYEYLCKKWYEPIECKYMKNGQSCYFIT